MEVGPPHVGPYELVERLGAGGMAETFVALRRGPGGFEQRVCLKRILPGRSSDEEFVRLFLEEARIAARLRHANVVSVLDFGEADGAWFLALELVDGVDLRGLLRDHAARGETLEPALVVQLALSLAAALEHAHTADPRTGRGAVVHRDLSPSNVLLSTAGEVKLADFGIAKAEERTRVTRTGVSRGKVPYMAPEYALEGRCDARSDLFSLGVTLYECLAGRRPFDGATDVDTLRRASEGQHVPLGVVRPDAPGPLVAAVERLLATDPNDRFPDAGALQDALVDVAPSPTAQRRLGERVRRAAALRAPAAAPASPGAPGGAPSVAPVPAAPEAPTRTAAPGSGAELAGSADTTHPRRAPQAPAPPTWRSPGAGAGDDAAGGEPATRGGPQLRAAAAVLGALAVAGALAALGVHAPGTPGPQASAAGASGAPGAATPPPAPPRTTPPRERPGPGAEAAARTGDESPRAPDTATAIAARAPDPSPAADARDGDASAAPGPTREAAARRQASPESRAADPGADRAPGGGGVEPAGDRGDPDGPDEARGRAALRVFVLPHGRVSVDGGPRRQAPASFRLQPGRHRVEVYQEGALVRRSWVTLEAGAERRLHYP